MPLRQHLEELRSCLFRSFIVFVLLFIVGFIFVDELISFIILPYEWARARIVENGSPDPGTLVLIRPAEGFIFAMKVAGSFAILGGVPLFLLIGARPELRNLRSSLLTPGGLVSDVVILSGLDAGAAMRLATNVIGATF